MQLLSIDPFRGPAGATAECAASMVHFKIAMAEGLEKRWRVWLGEVCPVSNRLMHLCHRLRRHLPLSLLLLHLDLCERREILMDLPLRFVVRSLVAMTRYRRLLRSLS